MERHTEQFLSQMSDTEMRKIWQDTESGIMAIEQGFDEMEVCRAAQGIIKKKRRRRKKT